jgi:glycosyltransferase involved in cell wall biosynthesis
MAQKLITLLRNPDTARRMGENGKAKIVEEFSCEAQLTKTESLYNRLLRQA